MSEYNKQQAREVADQMLGQGFRVWIAEKGNYGFYSDTDGSKLVSFQFNGLENHNYGGNYKTSSPTQTGRGWALETDTFERMFRQAPPRWAVGSATHRPTTVKEHLDFYGKSSNYSEIK